MKNVGAGTWQADEAAPNTKPGGKLRLLNVAEGFA